MSKPKKEGYIYDEYFDYVTANIEKYGKQTAVFMQVGSFYEMYGLIKDGVITKSNIQEITSLCGLNVSKKTEGRNGTIIMAGVPDHSIEKFLKIIVQQDYTVCLYDQHKEGKKTWRTLSQVYSKGTVLYDYENENHQRSNNTCCIWAKKYKKITNKEHHITIGMSFINVLSGQTYLFEYSSPFILNNTLTDELERQLLLFSPNEILFISNLTSGEQEKIFSYCSLVDKHVKIMTDVENEEVKNSSKIDYINLTMSTYFGEDIMQQCVEFSYNLLATQSLCYLLHFLKEHSPMLVNKLEFPQMCNKSDYVLLANHTLKQLNIIGDGNGKGKTNSVCDFLNNCITSIGKRYFKFLLLNPSSDVDWLNNEYAINTHFEDYYNNYDIREHISHVKDIEFIIRSCISNRSTPKDIYTLHTSIVALTKLMKHYKDDKLLNKYFFDTNDVEDIEQQCLQCLQYMDDTYDLLKCETLNTIVSIDDNILKPGVTVEYDDLINKYNNQTTTFTNILDTLNQKLINNGQSDFFKINEKEKSWKSIMITKTRTKNVKKYFENDDETFDYSKVSFSSSTTTNNEVKHHKLDTCIFSVIKMREKGVIMLRENFTKCNNTLVECYNEIIQKMCKFLAKVDVLQTRIYNAKKYNYVLPEIVVQDNSFFKAENIRHCLIEHINQNEVYVTNDVNIGNNDLGILLYGTNAVGKTSLIRAIGINMILAQSGMYVPCSKFVYMPYKSIFSRIIGNDNLFKGLSTFAVEMSELRVILNNVDENSLVLGDELCSGTEMESAISIFLAGLRRIYNSGASHIFATHLHEVVNNSEIKEMKHTKLMHMTVRYDNEKQDLVYDRKLKPGSGVSCYGLEVCKSLYLDNDFMEDAYNIRKKYFPETQGLMSLKVSSYNSKKIKTMCEMCNEKMGEHIHHMNEQVNSNNDGFIDHFHKNNVANLMSLCQECHNKIHKDNTQLMRKKTAKGKVVNKKVSL
uniref:DNA mismatch repair proteins mutS family domain-containing protein n=1 Tax=viral metagenome TaxID=1070528 RepID=A0A6C0C3E7_9ZZZZ